MRWDAFGCLPRVSSSLRACVTLVCALVCTYRERPFTAEVDHGENRSAPGPPAGVPSGSTLATKITRSIIGRETTRIREERGERERVRSRRFRATACTSTGRPWSCALTTALPGVLTDSARLGSARHTVRRSAAQTRRGEMRRGRLPSHDYRTTDPSVRLRAHFGSYASGSVQAAIPTLQPCQFNHSMGALDFFPLLSFLLFPLPFFPSFFHPPFFLPSSPPRDLSYFFGNAPRSTSKQTIRLARFAHDSSSPRFFFYSKLQATHSDRATGYLFLDRFNKDIAKRIESVLFRSRCASLSLIAFMVPKHFRRNSIGISS